MYPSCKKDTYDAMIHGLQWAIAQSDRRRRAGITGLTLVASGGLIRLDRASAFSHQERLKAASAERTMSQWPAPKRPGKASLDPRRRNAMPAWQCKARFGRQGAASPQQSVPSGPDQFRRRHGLTTEPFALRATAARDAAWLREGRIALWRARPATAIVKST